MFPMDRKALNETPITIEFDGMRGRIRKTLENAIKARTFYLNMFMQKRNPRVIGPVPQEAALEIANALMNS